MVSGETFEDGDYTYYYEFFLSSSNEYNLFKLRRNYSINVPNTTLIKTIFIEFIEINGIQPFVLRIILISFAYFIYLLLISLPMFTCMD